MTKFKVGDKARFIENFGSYDVGDVIEITGVKNGSHIYFEGTHGKGDCYTKRIELAEPKPTKNQRITALENEVSELKLIVHQLRKPSTVNEEVSASSVEDNPFGSEDLPLEEKSPNQLRAEIIEKAKSFVEAQKHEGAGKAPYRKYFEGKSGSYQGVDIEFIVNVDKRTVVAIARNCWKKSEILERGIAKCMPSDVFNEHIGKAIALGRALGLDVSEFEQAVQPNEVVKGQIYEETERGYSFQTTKVTDEEVEFKKLDGTDYKGFFYKWRFDDLKRNDFKLINDTNAIYRGVE